ncbi:MAG: DJ-1/PfpI family protein [Peptococcaceae bacterium]|nr:DJ-1/PfpI family protein [Peptococcaceae bacterium]
MALQDFNILLYEEFEILDAFGPVEVIGELKEHYRIRFVSQNGGPVTCKQQAAIDTLPFGEMDSSGVLLIPGGYGTRPLVEDVEFMTHLRSLAEAAPYVLTVCSGSAVLARTHLLDGRKATSNKLSFAWVMTQGEQVDWQKKARWVKDGKYYTSSGVSAGIDMALGFVSDRFGEEKAMQITKYMEYLWNRNQDNDPFAI